MKVKARRTFGETVALVFATWMCSGLIPPIVGKGMAGAYGSIASMPLCWWVVSLCWSHPLVGASTYAGMAILVTVVGVLGIPIAEEVLGPMTDWKGKTKIRDQNQIVIDEVLGMLVACLPIVFYHALPWLSFLVALLAFRVFDTYKFLAWPAAYFDRMKNSWGVMLDDFFAGAWAALVVFLFSKIYESFYIHPLVGQKISPAGYFIPAGSFFWF